MNHQLLRHRTIGLLLLISVSAAGLLGPSLHAVTHFHDVDSSGAAKACSCCSVSHSNAPSNEGEGAVGENHDCAICRFLALAQRVDDCTVAVEMKEDPVGEAFASYLFEPCRTFSLRFAPRGPPCFA